jgi:hypothetical protein
MSGRSGEKFGSMSETTTAETNGTGSLSIMPTLEAISYF